MTCKRSILGLLFLGLMACKTGSVHINVTYERLHGLQLADRVLFQENVAGSVNNIQYAAGGTYTLELKIVNGFTNAVTEYSQFHIIDDPNRDGHKAVEIRLTQSGGKLLANGATVPGMAPPEMLTDRLRKDLEAGFDFIISQIEKFNRDVQKIPDSEAYQELKKSMEALADDIRRAEKEAREKVKKEWLPRIERQLDELRKQLQQLGREKELSPLEERVERIRRI